MILAPAAVRIFLAREPADMRRSFTGLCGLVRDGLGADPLSGCLYCFRNKRGDKLKMLYFDRTGLAIWYKQLQQGRFHWPPMQAASKVIVHQRPVVLYQTREGETRLATVGGMAKVFPKCAASPEVLARIATDRLHYHLTLYRIERWFAEQGCPLV